MEDLNNVAAETPPADDSVRSVIERAVTEQRDRQEAAPSDKGPVEQTQDRARDDHGRFARQEAEQQQKAAANPTPPQPQKAAANSSLQAQQNTGAQLQPDAAAAATAVKPPVGWPAAAKAAFDTLPQDVRDAVAKRETEVNRGFEVLKNYKGLEEFQPYMDSARTSHAEVMRRAIEWEKSLVADPIGTVRHVASLTRLDPRVLAQALLNPAQPMGRPQQPQPQQAPVDVNAAVERALQQREISGQVSQFLSDPTHEHAGTLADDMALLISQGRADSLQDAYDKAAWAHPEIRETLINQRLASQAPSNGARAVQAATQARAAAKAVTGAPAGGRSPGGPASNPQTVREAIRAAIDSQR